MGRRFKAALAGYYGFKNFGDELLLHASINALERAGIKRDEMIILSNNPAETQKNFNVNAVSRWSFHDVKKALNSSENLIFGGGGIFQDSTSIKSCVWYWGLIKLARLCGVNILALGQSIGPLKSSLGKFFAKDALQSLKALHVRDEPSLIYAKNFNLANIFLGHDLALTLDLNFNKNNKNQDNCGEILLNLRPHKNIKNFIEQAKNFLDQEKFLGKKIIGVALSPEDAELLNNIKWRGEINISRVEIFDEINKLKNINNLWQNAKFALGMRLHFIIISFMMHTPFKALSYDPKVAAFEKWVNEDGNKDNFSIERTRIKMQESLKILFKIYLR